MDWTSFLRQLYICTGIWTVYFMQGLCIGFPTVLFPQLRRANQTVSIEQVSWYMSTSAYNGIPWLIVQSVLVTTIGRKKTHIIVCSSSLIGFSIYYFSTNINHFLIGELFQAALHAAGYITILTILTEYTSSKYRGVFLTIKSATFFWGVLVSNTIGTFFHWQNIVILGLTCVVYTLVNAVIWPESPLWLATKGKFVECSEAHRWLKGNDESSEKELDKLLKSQETIRLAKQQWSTRYIFQILKRKQYLKPLFLSVLLIILYCFSGKLICTVYAIDVLKKISSSESTAYSGMLILDGVTVASMYLACILSKFLKRRIILIGFSLIGIIVMIIISIYLYIASLSVIEENKYISIFLLAIYSIAVSCGPMLMSTTIIGELLPLESRILSLFLFGFAFKIIYGTFVKFSPLCFQNLGMHGTFLLYAISSLICLVIIYFVVPETKDKTIQEIDEYLRGEEKDITEENSELLVVNNFKK